MAARTSEQMGLSQAGEILKNDYLPAVKEAFNNETVLASRLKRKKAMVQGNKYVFATHAARNWGVGPRPESGVTLDGGGTTSTDWSFLPPPGMQVYDQAYLQRTHLYGRMKVSGAALSAARGDGAMVDLLGNEMRGLKNDLMKAFNRNLFGKAYGGLAAVTATATSTTVTVDTVARLEVGMPVTVAVTRSGTATGGEVVTGGSQVIVTIPTSTSFTVAANVTATDSCTVYLDGEYGDTAHASSSWGFDGLEHIVGNTTTTRTYADITSAAYWGTEVEDNNAAGLSVKLMLDMQARMRKNANGKLSLVITSDQQWRNYGEIMTNKQQWVGNVKKLDGGYDALDFHGVPVVWDPDCDPDKMYFLDESTFKILEEEPLGFIDRDGSVLTRVGSGAAAEDAYEATLVWRGSLQCDNPLANACIIDLPVA